MNLLVATLKMTTGQKIKFPIKDFFSKCDKSAVSCKVGQIY